MWSKLQEQNIDRILKLNLSWGKFSNLKLKVKISSFENPFYLSYKGYHYVFQQQSSTAIQISASRTLYVFPLRWIQRSIECGGYES